MKKGLLMVLLLVPCVFIAVVATAVVRRSRNNDAVLRGIIQASTPLQTPLSQRAACTARLDWEGRYEPHFTDESYLYRTTTRYAPDATLEIEGQTYTIVGSGGGAGSTTAGDAWQWRQSDGFIGRDKVPAALWGWDGRLDDLLNYVATGEGSDHNEISLTITEYYIPCGQQIGLRGTIQGNTIQVDTSS